MGVKCIRTNSAEEAAIHDLRKYLATKTASKAMLMVFCGFIKLDKAYSELQQKYENLYEKHQTLLNVLSEKKSLEAAIEKFLRNKK